MLIEITDYNGADDVFANVAAGEWNDIEAILASMTPYMQPSGQAGIEGTPIFDPKATNAHLTAAAHAAGWSTGVPVPEPLRMFGRDWDAGKGPVLAEWQFSNYPFLWNNVIRTEAVMAGGVGLPGLQPIQVLIVVAKSGSFPASNSTLYYEQARAQLDAVMSYETFSLPIRLVGLMIPTAAATLDVRWSTYPSRYSREPDATVDRTMSLAWGNLALHGNAAVTMT